MSITNGSLITAADLNAMTSTALGQLRTDNAQLPLGKRLNLSFSGLTAAIVAASPQLCRKTIVVPFDCYVEVLAVTASGMTAASTTTVAIAGDGALPNFPISATATTGAGVVEFGRTLFDGTKGRVGKANMPTNQAFRAFTQGSTLTITATTTSVAANAVLQVEIVIRSFLGRN